MNRLSWDSTAPRRLKRKRGERRRSDDSLVTAEAELIRRAHQLGVERNVALKIMHLARWFAWQIREPETLIGHGEARITVISGGR